MPDLQKCICTVLLITYNHAPYIRAAIESVLEQKTKYKYKIHIFDDASNDGTSDIVREYAEKYPELITAYIAENNQGAQTNIWNAYKSVDTEYCILLECDDYWCDEKKLELQIDAMEANPECSFCAHNTIAQTLDENCREYADNTLWVQRSLFKIKKIIYYRDIEHIGIGGYIPHISTRLIRIKFLDLDKIKNKESILFDFNQYFYLLLKGPYYYINKAMTVYQKTGSGIHSGKSPLAVLNQEYPWIVDFNNETNLVIADKIFREYRLQTDHRLKLHYDYRTGYQPPILEKLQDTKVDEGKVQAQETELLSDNIEVLKSELVTARCELKSLRSSVSFRMGRIMTSVPRKIRGLYRCYKDHGFFYTYCLVKKVLSDKIKKTLSKAKKNSSLEIYQNKGKNIIEAERMARVMELDAVKADLDKDKYYYLCNAGVGDTMLVCALHKELERKHEGTVHLLIPPEQEFLMEMYACSEYTLTNFRYSNINALSDECPLPRKGKIFVAHPCAHKELKRFFKPIYEQVSTVKFYPWFLEFLGLDKSVHLGDLVAVPQMSEQFRKRCESIAAIDKIVVMCMEATSMLWLPDTLWIEKARELKRQGYTVISNAKDPVNTIPGTIYLEMTLEEAVALSYACHSVYALRSGFCDAVFAKGKDLHVYYPRHSSLFIYSMNDMFDRRDINEEIFLV